jgi:hypothetical protein
MALHGERKDRDRRVECRVSPSTPSRSIRYAGTSYGCSCHGDQVRSTTVILTVARSDLGCSCDTSNGFSADSTSL